VSSRLLFDVTGLIHWYAYFSHHSGIQRVTQKILGSNPIQQSQHVELVARAPGDNVFYKVDAAMLHDLEVPERRPAAIGQLRALFTKSMRRSGPGSLWSDMRSDMWFSHLPYVGLGLCHLELPVQAWFSRRLSVVAPQLREIPPPGPDDTLLNPGDPWWQVQGVAFLLDLKSRRRVRLVQIVHDLFSIERPEWFTEAYTRMRRSDLSKLAPHVDHWLTTSRFVAGQVATYLSSQNLPTPPITVLPMGWDSFCPPPDDERQHDRAVLRHYGLLGKPFILFVGTIEPRKNLSMLLDVMERLRRTTEQVPNLVVVGRYGWGAPEVRARLRRNPFVRWFRSVGDADLRALYRGARFTIVPAHVEGWGLPVQESIIHGTPCLASSGGALTESGRGLVTHFDPARPDDLEASLRAWMTDDVALEQARSQIATALRTTDFPTWDDTGRVVLEQGLRKEER
jgi:glycosyltransferase involved in cell wall biosynthesis